MKIIYGSGRLKKIRPKKPVLAIGVFDGVHLAHQSIIKKTVQLAGKIGGTSVVLTFYPHPNHVLRGDKNLALLVSLKHRLRLIAGLKADICIVIDFTRNFSKLSAQEFVKNFIVDNIRPVTIFVGADFVFGKDRSGNVNLLKKLGAFYGFKTIKVAALKIGSQTVSSTLIRRLIRGCKFEKAGLFLGRPVSILGKVERGKGAGRALGFPTANLSCLSDALPCPGVYAVKVIFKKKKFLGMAFVSEERGRDLEAHIFNFKKNLYGKELEIEFYKKMRSVKKFKELDLLKKQIEEDEKKVKKFFHRSKISSGILWPYHHI